MKVIDARVRPPHREFSSLHIFRNLERNVARFGIAAARSALTNSFEVFLEELQTAGIGTAVVVGREAAEQFGRVPNETVRELVRAHPHLFVGVGAIDPTVHPSPGDRTAELVEKFGFAAVAVDAGWAAEPLRVDAPPFRAVYAAAGELRVPVYLTVSGSVGPDIEYSNPVAIDRAAAAFPATRFVVVHAAWPWVHQMLGVAFKRPNVFLLPDVYGLLGMPGADQYAAAARGFLRERVLFGSSYPVGDPVQMVEGYQRLGLPADVLEDVMFKNAGALLGIADSA